MTEKLYLMWMLAEPSCVAYTLPDYFLPRLYATADSESKIRAIAIEMWQNIKWHNPIDNYCEAVWGDLIFYDRKLLWLCYFSVPTNIKFKYPDAFIAASISASSKAQYLYEKSRMDYASDK